MKQQQQILENTVARGTVHRGKVENNAGKSGGGEPHI